MGSKKKSNIFVHWTWNPTILLWQRAITITIKNTRHRIALTKLRLSNHKLAIETGRYSRPFKKPAERTCPICKIEMEDEYHFLNICPAYQEKRSSLLDYLKKGLTNKKASTVLCSVVKQARSGRARKKCRGKHET